METTAGGGGSGCLSSQESASSRVAKDRTGGELLEGWRVSRYSSKPWCSPTSITKWKAILAILMASNSSGEDIRCSISWRWRQVLLKKSKTLKRVPWLGFGVLGSSSDSSSSASICAHSSWEGRRSSF